MCFREQNIRKKTPELQANKIQQSFDLGRYATLYAMGLKVVYKKFKKY